ncbi:Ribose import permease protein RbsC [subsurface metagenome]
MVERMGKWEFLRTITRKYGTTVAGIFIFIGFSCTTKYFFTTHNFLLMLKQMSMLTIISLGFTFVMAAGGFDMSIGFATGLINVFFASVLLHTGNLPLAILIALLMGSLVGLTNGALAAYIGLPDFIATFAVGSIALGIDMLFTGGNPVFLQNPPEAFLFIGQGYLGPVPFPAIVMFVVLAMALIVLNRTKLGMRIYAIGGNPVAALYAGINVRFYRLLTFIISGLSVAAASVVLTSRLGSGQPQAGENYLLDAISVCFLSTTMFGEGEPTGEGVFVGAFIITMLSSGLTMLNVAYYFQYITKGVIVILAVTSSILMGQKLQVKI